MKKFHIISLVLLVITTFISMDLLFNLIGSIIPSMNDGIGTHSIIWGNLYFGEDHWTHEKFFNAFVISSLISFGVFIENTILTILSIKKQEE